MRRAAVVLALLLGAMPAASKDGSSNDGYFGIPDSKADAACSGRELIFNRGSVTLQAPTGPVAKFSGKYAMLSPDCQYFWLTDGVGEITLHDAGNGSVMAKTTGRHPAWSPDSKAVYYVVTGLAGKPSHAALYRWDVAAGKSTEAVKVKDWGVCAATEGRHDWWPPRFENGRLLWEYYSPGYDGDREPEEDETLTKTLVIDPQTHKVKDDITGSALCEPAAR